MHLHSWHSHPVVKGCPHRYPDTVSRWRPKLLGTLLGLAWLGAAATLSGCQSAAQETVLRDNGEVWPATLRIAYKPSQDEAQARLESYNELATYLEQRLGIAVQLIRSTSSGPAIEAMRAKKVDLMADSPIPYLIAKRKAGAEALVTHGKPDGTQGTYSSILVTSPKTGIHSIEDLRARAKDSTLAFVDPTSTSGHLIPRGYLESIGLIPEQAFREVVFAQEHLNVAMTAVAAKVEVAAMSRSSYDRFVENGRIDPDELLILWESEPIPSQIWAIRGELPQGLKDAVQRAFLEMHERAPTLIAHFRERARDPELVYVAISDTAIEHVREIALNLESMTLLQ